MKALVVTEHYPDNNGSVALMYVHTRNMHYCANGIDVTVLNFQASESYIRDGIPVITMNDYRRQNTDYDVLILHAANVRHHFVFLKKYGMRFPKFIFFYHGHEVVRINKTYSRPYPYVKRDKAKEFAQDIYDTFKLAVWRKYLPSVAYKSQFVFVSEWMLAEFLKWTKINPRIIENKYAVIYNCVGKSFELSRYDVSAPKEYDFVTVRGNLDGSKYAIDVVNRLAYNTPDKKFLIVGKGRFFDYNPKAPNVEWWNQTMTHDEIIGTLQKARFALMPTRTDAQGLMMCEMAAMGIPVITSDIPVCHEVFDGFGNVFFINNDDATLSLDSVIQHGSRCLKDARYYEEATVMKEVQLLKEMYGDVN